MSLDKVLQFAAGPVRPADPSEYVRAASESLDELARLLGLAANADEDDDGEGEEPDEDEQDDGEDDDEVPKGKGGKKMPPQFAKKGKKKPPAKDTVKASQVLVRDAMLALSHLRGSEVLVLSFPQPHDPVQAVLELAKGGGMDVAMEHGPMNGEHEHPHRVVQVHSHKHTHNGDGRHTCGDSYGGMY